ncbi:TPA: hypothetical protein DD394_09060 [bacterium UBP9_UBA11836]|nr:hypothetical protein [bacterium UBP9_UBA11836]
MRYNLSIKYLSAAILSVGLCLGTLLPAQAELVPPPVQDFSHTNACTPVSRKAVIQANSHLYVSPLSSIVSARVGKSKKKVRVTSAYTAADGSRWLKVVLPDSHQGWTLQSNMLGVVDARTFALRHRKAIKKKRGALTKFTQNQPVIFWTYPNSGEIYAQADGDPEMGIGYDQICIDHHQRVWGHVAYYRSIRDVWICLSAPHSTSF